MNRLEIKIVQKAKGILKQNLDPLEICDVLYQNGMLKEKHHTELFHLKSKRPRRKVCRKFLDIITRHNTKCTFYGLIEALRHNATYTFLADELIRIRKVEKSRVASRVKTNTRQTGKPTCKHCRNCNKAIVTDRDTEIENALEHISRDNVTDNMKCIDGDTEMRGKYQLCKIVDKIDLSTARRERVVALTYRVKRLCHQGDMDTLTKLIDDINLNFENASLPERMGELADMKFVTLEGMVTVGRIKYLKHVCAEYLDKMEKIIRFTSQPVISSMTHLARYGSFVAMEGNLDDGLDLIQCARQHSESVHAGLETGMVYYIQLNLLIQKYENNPTREHQKQVLATAELVIAQFQEEPDKIRLDYERMAFLKMVFCHLGIGIFGNSITSVKPTAKAMTSAKSFLDILEKPDNFNDMETRRTMLFHIAKSVFYQHERNKGLALLNGREAKRIAIENEWIVELPNIIEHVQTLEMM